MCFETQRRPLVAALEGPLSADARNPLSQRSPGGRDPGMLVIG
jgi:hypothetical protein